MDHKELAQTGLHLPEIGIGTWKFKGGTEPIRKAIECGASLIDTAELYGNEQLVGQALQGIRNQVFLATKVSPQHFSRADILQFADKSLQLLGTDRIDLYQLHRPSYTVSIAETMGAMEELVDAGKVRFIGVSNFAVPELKQAMAAMRRMAKRVLRAVGRG